MRVLIFHGYLLSGTGSNVYNAELAAAFVRGGHEVHLLCQDRDPLAQSWVDAAGDWDGGSLEVRERVAEVRATVYRPDIGGLLPLYVADRYEGIEARPFSELTDAEVSRYVEANVAAVREVAALVKPDVALANHLVMGPVVLARALADARVPYAVKIHGSALEYTVKPQPERFLPYAREGLASARGILVGSRHTAESLWAALDDPAVTARTRLGPPGVDITRFTPREPAEARAGLVALRERLAAVGLANDASREGESGASGGVGGRANDALTESGPGASGGAAGPVDDALGGGGAEVVVPGDSFARAAGEASAALATVAEGDRLVVFVGKLIASKGVELLLAAWPLVLAREPRARLVVVGFGAFRAALEGLARDLEAGDLEAAAALRAEDGRELPELGAFLESLQGSEAEAYRLAAHGVRDRIAWAGRLDHDELADILPAAEAMAVTSTFPESFGMVAAEAAACGALPVVADHSGLAEVAHTLGAAAPDAARPWLTFAVGAGAVRELADDLSAWLAAPEDVRAATRAAIVKATRDTYSWDGVARSVVAAAQGDLDSLPLP